MPVAGQDRSGGEQDVYGEAINMASRIEREATAGEIWLSESAWLVADRDEVAIQEIGARTLRGLPEPVRIFRVAPAAEPTPPDETPEVAVEPPYGNAALTRVRGLKPPDPLGHPVLIRLDPRDLGSQGVDLLVRGVLPGAAPGEGEGRRQGDLDERERMVWPVHLSKDTAWASGGPKSLA